VRKEAAGEDIRIVGANQASWADLEAVLGSVKCHGNLCYCQRFKILERDWRRVSDDERAHLLREQTDCGHPRSKHTSGLVAFLGDGTPAAWCAVEPRSAYSHLRNTAWVGRREDRGDSRVWAVTCFVVRLEYRRRGITYLLARRVPGSEPAQQAPGGDAGRACRSGGPIAGPKGLARARR